MRSEASDRSDAAEVRIAPERRVTMTDVANLAGCSQSTVSIVLNDAPGVTIAEATRARVREAAATLGYVLPRASQSEARPARQVAVVFDTLATSPEAVESIDGIREAGWAEAYVVAAYQTANDPRMAERTLRAALASGVDALIYATVMSREVAVPKLLDGLDVPVVLLNCTTADRRFPSVLPGEVAGGHLATRTLARAGHRRIAHITGEMWMDAARNRAKGYRQALASAEIPFDPDLVRHGDWQASSGHAHTLALLDGPDPPTAIFCANDRMAVGAYEAIKELGLGIPGDVSVVGYDDQEIARQLTPALTTLVLPHREMGAWAFETVMDLRASRSRPDHFPVVKLECGLVERDSVAPPLGGGDRARTA